MKDLFKRLRERTISMTDRQVSDAMDIVEDALFERFPWMPRMLDEYRGNVIVEMAFYLGIDGLANDYAKMLELVEKGHWDKAADEILGYDVELAHVMRTGGGAPALKECLYGV